MCFLWDNVQVIDVNRVKYLPDVQLRRLPICITEDLHCKKQSPANLLFANLSSISSELGLLIGCSENLIHHQRLTTLGSRNKIFGISLPDPLVRLRSLLAPFWLIIGFHGPQTDLDHSVDDSFVGLNELTAGALTVDGYKFDDAENCWVKQSLMLKDLFIFLN